MKANQKLIGLSNYLVLLWPFLAGCMSAEDSFTSGRIENLCSGAIPICGDVAGCVLNTDQYLRGEFPGDQVVVVRSDFDRARLVVRFLLSQEMYPGMLLSVRGCSIGCSQCDEKVIKDKNLFDEAGDDGILEYHLTIEGRGDHKVEFFSDMAAAYYFTVELEE